MLLSSRARLRDELDDAFHRSHGVDVGHDVHSASMAGIRVHRPALVHGERPAFDGYDGLTDEREQRQGIVETHCRFVVRDNSGTVSLPPGVDHRAEHGRRVDEGAEVGGGWSHADGHVERAEEQPGVRPITARAAAGSVPKLCSTSRSAPR